MEGSISCTYTECTHDLTLCLNVIWTGYLECCVGEISINESATCAWYYLSAEASTPSHFRVTRVEISKEDQAGTSLDSLGVLTSEDSMFQSLEGIYFHFQIPDINSSLCSIACQLSPIVNKGIRIYVNGMLCYPLDPTQSPTRTSRISGMPCCPRFKDQIVI